ncbi:MAG: nicotinate-nucleotide adenylyltransferase [Xanthomonadales bacterium]|nr:nicotinate-nucleotide adenylyltransferase [Xanthomonadales bacterium]
MRISKQPPLAFFGGTFDPVHYAHLRCAEQARSILQLEKLYLLPAGDPPHKNTPFTTAAQRLDMLRLALADYPALDIDDRECRRDGPSFMVDTLHELRTEYPGQSILLLIGQDAINYLHTWHQWRQLFSLAHIITFPRPGAAPAYLPELAAEIERRYCSDPQALAGSTSGKVLHLDLELIDISATAIQAAIRRGQPLNGMSPAPVLQYIADNRLYLSA